MASKKILWNNSVYAIIIKICILPYFFYSKLVLIDSLKCTANLYMHLNFDQSMKLKLAGSYLSS